MEPTVLIAGTKIFSQILKGFTIKGIREILKIKDERALLSSTRHAKESIQTMLGVATKLNQEKANVSTSINSYLKLSNEGTWADVQQAINAVGPLLHKFQTTVVEASIAMIKMGLFSQADELIEKLQQQASMYNELSKIPAPKTQKQRQSLQRLSSALDKLRKEVSSVEAKLNKAGATLKVS